MEMDDFTLTLPTRSFACVFDGLSIIEYPILAILSIRWTFYISIKTLQSFEFFISKNNL
jgi:hypothetical protein